MKSTTGARGNHPVLNVKLRPLPASNASFTSSDAVSPLSRVYSSMTDANLSSIDCCIASY